MSKNIISKFMVSIMIITLVFSMLSTACAGTSTTDGKTYPNGNANLIERLKQVPEFKFYHHKYGIGYGDCPVYTAPYANAYRCSNGKASCSTDYTMDEAGYIAGWLLVRYETNNGGYRVGYIPPKYVQGYKSKMGQPQFENIPVTAAERIMVTDNPLLLGSSFAVLEPGETFYILAKYTYYGDWWYIECTVDNQPARGFIDRNSVSFYMGDANTSTVQIPGNMESSQVLITGVSASAPQLSVQTSSDSYPVSSAQAITSSLLNNPSVSPLGTTQIGEVYIEYAYSGDMKIVRKAADQNSQAVAGVQPGETFPCYAVTIGTTNKDWYYIWIEKESAWGWISSNVSTLLSNKDGK